MNRLISIAKIKSMEKRNPSRSPIPSNERLLYSYQIFSNVTKALLAALDLLKREDSVSPEYSTVIILLAMTLKICSRDLYNQLQTYHFFKRDNILGIIYGYLARTVDLSTSLEDIKRLQGGKMKTGVGLTLHIILEEIARLEEEFQRFNKIVDKILEKI